MRCATSTRTGRNITPFRRCDGMTLRWVEIGEIVVVSDPGELTGLLDEEIEFSVAALRHDRGWYLFQQPDLEDLRVPLGAGVTPPELLLEHPEVLELKVVPDRVPRRPAVVLDADEGVLGAWVPTGRTVSAAGRCGGGRKTDLRGKRSTVRRAVAAPPTAPREPDGTIARTPPSRRPRQDRESGGERVPVSPTPTRTSCARAGRRGLVLSSPGVDAVDVGVLLQLSGTRVALGSEYASIVSPATRRAQAGPGSTYASSTTRRPAPAAISALSPCAPVLRLLTRTWDWCALRVARPAGQFRGGRPVQHRCTSAPPRPPSRSSSRRRSRTESTFKCAVQRRESKGSRPHELRGLRDLAEGYRYVKELLDGWRRRIRPRPNGSTR